MIPRTFPSTFASNGQQQMVVHFLTSVEGLARWSDYIPVKLAQGGPENSYSGCIDVVAISELTADTHAWKEYIPVYADSSATDAWTVNSVGYIPYNYALFADAAMQLDLTNGAALDPRITFSRTTNATLTNSAGLIANAPQNLLTHSEQFDNAAWNKSATTVTANAVVAPNGTTTADTLTSDGTSTQHNVSAAPTLAATTAYAFSVYAKAGTTNFLQITTNLTAGSANHYANFNLQTGVVSAVGSSATATIAAVGNGWYRCTAVMTTLLTSASATFILIPVDSGTATRNPTFSTVTSVQLWGAQLELGSTATTYNPTTIKNLLGFTENFDNAAWTKSNAFVQTNLVINSVFANTGGAAPTGFSQAIGTGTSAPSGTAGNGGTIYTQTATAARPFFSRSITTVVGVVYTQSMTITEASGVQVGQVLGVSGITPTFTLNGVAVLATAAAVPGVVAATWTATGTASDVRFGIGGSGAATGSISFHGAQLVQGTTPGDYKATYAAAAAVGYTDIYGQPFAQKLVEDTATGLHGVTSAVITLAGTSGTLSVYAKAGERNWVRLGHSTVSGSDTWFNLSTGTVGTVGAATTATSIDPIGNGWYRCSITVPIATSGTYNVRAATANGVFNYTGDGTSGIYIFGAQLSDSASVDPYVYQPVAAPTSTAYYGPRFDYDPVTLAPKGLLIEEQRTNLVLQSQTFGTGWSLANMTVTSDVATSPDGAPTADRITEAATTSTHLISQANISLTLGTTYTFSLYVKKGVLSAARNFVQIATSTVAFGTNSYANFDLVNGTVASQGAGVTSASIQNAGNGWWRCSFVDTAVATGTGSFFISGTDSGTAGVLPSYTGDSNSDMLIYGAQLEAGSFATSYIGTVASQVTRAADSASMIGNNFARWYNGNTNTFYVSVSYYGQLIGTAIETNGIYLNNGTVLNQIAVRTVRDPSNAQADVIVVSNSSTQLDTAGLAPVAANTVYKRAFAYATNSAQNCTNGALDGSTATSFVLPTGINALSIPGVSTAMHISRIAYYNRRLSNTELQGITS